MIPDGYIEGANRLGGRGEDYGKTHLYKGDFGNPGLPMCRFGWNRGEGYSIWRGNVSAGGICEVCLARARAGKSGVRWKERYKPIYTGSGR